jgi:1,5-anhydro-D-fructose reductase (1,5-anhydro-D-mannitol-forming)
MDPIPQLIRWGILGCGDVTEAKSGPAYQQTQGFELSAVMARTPGKSEDYAKRHQVPRFFTDAQALINDPQIDAIYIATPPDSHMDYAIQVAEAGKICSVEKPLALNYRQCIEVHNAFKHAKVPVFVAYYRRCLPVFKRIKHWINTGEIGNLRHVDWQYSRPSSELDRSQQKNWRTEKDIAPGGYFDDIACHGLDLLTFLCGDVLQVSGNAVNQQNLYSAYDAMSASLLFENGATGTGSWNFGSFSKRDKVTIIGDKGQIRFSVFSEQAGVLENAQGSQIFEMTKPVPIQKDYVQAMADCLLLGTPHPSDANSASHTSWIMDQILKSEDGQYRR